MTTTLANPLAVRLASPDVEITEAPIDPTPCGRCGYTDAITVARVYPDECAPPGGMDVTETCRKCVAAVIAHALNERPWHCVQPIRVEVAAP